MIDWYGRQIGKAHVEAQVGHRPKRHAYTFAGVVRGKRPLAELFSDYLSADLRVRPRGFGGIFAWLRGCRYVRDPERYGSTDLWLHPEDFEKLREGDCEDHALWAWVQLVRQGRPARFTVGRREGGHAWVTLFDEEGVRLFETTRKDAAYVPRPWDGHPDYMPAWSVDGAGEFYRHG